MLGLSRSKAFEEARKYRKSGGRTGLPNLDFNSRYRCPTLVILRLLGVLDLPGDQGPDDPGSARAA